MRNVGFSVSKLLLSVIVYFSLLVSGDPILSHFASYLSQLNGFRNRPGPMNDQIESLYNEVKQFSRELNIEEIESSMEE